MPRRALRVTSYRAALARGLGASAVIAAVAFAMLPNPSTPDIVLVGRAPDLALAADVSHGLVLAGLAPDPRCGVSLAVDATNGDGLPACTHGPDPAPPGVDIAAANASPASVAPGAGVVGCYDDGTSGYRVQGIYAHGLDVADRYGTVVDALRTYAAAADGAFETSAAETGGDRHVRFVTEPDPGGSACRLSVLDVTLTASGDDSFSNTITELRAQGFNHPDRRYLVWMDSNVYCGIAQLRSDENPAQSNLNNGTYAGYARVDAGCWGNSAPVEAHELLHTLGGVQAGAPHATPGFHCFDEWDLMCYADGTGVAMQTVCTNSSHNALLDCNHDDYFSTSPAAGSYLATHWNAADSRFLTSLAPPGATTTTTVPDSTTSSSSSSTSSSSTSSTVPDSTTSSTVQESSTTVTAPPTTLPPTTVTSPPDTAPPATTPPPPPTPDPNLVVFVTGNIAKRTATRTYQVNSGAGTFNVAGGGTKPIAVVVRNAKGKIIAKARGARFAISVRLPRAGRYRISVTSQQCSFAFTVNYPRP